MLAGAIVGGLLLGLGSIVFLFPQMDSITALSGLVAAVTFIAAWSAAGRRFGYIGLQIAFSFFAVTLATSRAPTELAPARDRLVGIGLALIIMWFAFDQVWPVRTITIMRQALASVLHGEAQLLCVSGAEEQSPDLGSRIDGFRHDVSAKIAEIRSLNEAVLYEFGMSHEGHKIAGEVMLRAALTSGSLFWNELAVLERTQDRDMLKDEGLLNIRRAVAKRLETMAEAIAEQKPVGPFAGMGLDGEHLPPGAPETEYANTLLSRYKEVESILLNLKA
jgi:multidrug resistance protein MdtO